jgi:hypothetical protein
MRKICIFGSTVDCFGDRFLCRSSRFAGFLSREGAADSARRDRPQMDRNIRDSFKNPVAGITRSAREIREILRRIPIALTETAGSFQMKEFRFAGRVELTGKREFGEAYLVLTILFRTRAKSEAAPATVGGESLSRKPLGFSGKTREGGGGL